MKTLLASLILLNIACTNVETNTMVSYKPYELPMAELPIHLHGSVPSKTHDIMHWDKLSSDFYSDGDV